MGARRCCPSARSVTGTQNDRARGRSAETVPQGFGAQRVEYGALECNSVVRRGSGGLADLELRSFHRESAPILNSQPLAGFHLCQLNAQPLGVLERTLECEVPEPAVPCSTGDVDR